ncbi:MAG TPA: OmpH family outer membrane protein [Candidatus Acidoferrales bacterium]|nr:OmpH family outer membrane protein [Candidatus Acidoferrales bacterium]
MKVNGGVIVLAALLLTFAVATWPQSGGNSPAAPAGKVGVLNVRNAIVNTAEGKQASAELQSQFASRQNELESLRKQIEDLQSRLRSGERTLSDEEKGRLQREGELRARQFQRKQDELQEDMNGAQNEVVDRIGRKMLDVLDRYARENGYAAVFDNSGQNSPVIYASSQIDVTQDILRLYDQAYPVKGGAAAPARPQPSTPKPQPQAPKPDSHNQKPPKPE